MIYPTIEKPTEPGWYWFLDKTEPGSNWEAVHVQHPDAYQSLRCEWRGPIPEPSDGQERTGE